MRYKNWTEIDWDGNPDLGFRCYRKSFKRGYVSVGIGKFKEIVYSYGKGSEDSMCSTRWRADGDITELEAMALVDAELGKCGLLSEYRKLHERYKAVGLSGSAHLRYNQIKEEYHRHKVIDPLSLLPDAII